MSNYINFESQQVDSQLGFRPGFSTQDILVHIADSWRKAVDKSELVGAVFFDLAKSFDYTCISLHTLVETTLL